MDNKKKKMKCPRMIGEVAVLCRVFSRGLNERVRFEQRYAGGEEGSRADERSVGRVF